MEFREVRRARELMASGAAEVIRRGAGMSRGDVAGVLGVHETTVMRWEKGERVPRRGAALRYLRLLDEIIKGDRA